MHIGSPPRFSLVVLSHIIPYICTWTQSFLTKDENQVVSASRFAQFDIDAVIRSHLPVEIGQMGIGRAFRRHELKGISDGLVGDEWGRRWSCGGGRSGGYEENPGASEQKLA